MLCFQDMPNCHNRVIKDHARPGEAHHFPYFLSHLRFITMHTAIRAKRFILYERAMIAPFAGILCKRRTFRTEFTPGPVLFSAEKPDHQGNNLFFFLPLLLHIHFPHDNTSSVFRYHHMFGSYSPFSKMPLSSPVVCFSIAAAMPAEREIPASQWTI